MNMNKLKQIIAFLLILGLISCSKDDSNRKESEKESINNKWIVENSAEFKSIEFDDNGNYIITRNKSTSTSKMAETEEVVVLGTYEILDTDIFLLSDFGTVKFDDSDPNHIKFSIMYKGSNTYTYEMNVTKAEDFVSTPKTDLLCNHTWKFTRQMPINDTINLINFSKAGTCFTNFKIVSPESRSSAEFGKWKWKDSDETKIIITQIKSPQWIIDKDEEVELEITKLNSVRLELKEIYNGKAYDIAFDTTTVKINSQSSKKIRIKE